MSRRSVVGSRSRSTKFLGIDPTSARRKIQQVTDIAKECKQAAIAREEIVNSRLKDKADRIAAEIKEKEEILIKKRGQQNMCQI